MIHKSGDLPNIREMSSSEGRIDIIFLCVKNIPSQVDWGYFTL